MLTVTAVIPVHNRERFIARAIESASAQTYRPAEIIVVDDASLDGSPHIVENLARTVPNITLIKLSKNVGAAKARNIGAEAAKGDLLAFLDSDDQWHVRKLEKQVNEFRVAKDAVAVFCGLISTANGISYRYTPPSEISLSALYRSNVLITCSTALVSKDAFSQVSGFDPLLPSCQDWDLFIRLAEIGTIRVVQEELIEYYDGPAARISNNNSAVLLGHNILFDKIYSRLSDVNPISLMILRAGHQCILAEALCLNEPHQAFQHAMKGFAMAPSPRKLHVLAQVIKVAAQRELHNLRDKWSI